MVTASLGFVKVEDQVMEEDLLVGPLAMGVISPCVSSASPVQGRLGHHHTEKMGKGKGMVLEEEEEEMERVEVV